MTIQIDKITHALACYAIALTTGIFTNWWIGLTAAMVIGIAKEIYDKVSGKGTPELFDLLADAVGAALATLVIVLWI